MRLMTLAVLTALAIGGCGGGDDKKTATSTPTAAAQQGGQRLDEDALLGVHDALVTCAQGDKVLGLVTHLSGDRSISDKEGIGGSSYDDHLAAPKATVALTKKGAQYVGLRMGRGGVDILIFPTEEEADAGIKSLGTEAGTQAAQSDVFVNLSVKPSVSDEVVTAVDRCEGEAKP